MIALQLIGIAAFHFLVGVVVPGIALNRLFSKLDPDSRPDSLETVLQSIALGFLYNSFQFLCVISIARFGVFSQQQLVIMKYCLDLLILMYAVVRLRDNPFREILGELGKIFSDRGNALVIIGAFILGVFAIFYFPHVHDSSQLMWTSRLIDGFEKSAEMGTGAFGYSALIYFPGFVFKHIPLVVLAAGFKVCLSLLFGLATIYLISRLRFSSQLFAKIAFSIIIVLSHLGQYGLIVLGKDSVFGVVFSMMYLASLFSGKKDEASYIRSAIFFTCATTTGVITIPYLFLITFFYLLLSLGSVRIISFLFWLTAFSCIGLAVALQAMMKAPVIPVFCVLLAIAFFLHFLRKKPFFSLQGDPKTRSTVVVSAAVALLLFGSSLLMPVQVAVIPWSDAQGNPMIEYRPPLDGKMTFANFLFGFETDILRITVLLGLIGMLGYSFKDRFARNRGVGALALFPVSMIFIVLVLARSKFSPFSGFNLWDMIRDVPLWYGGIIFGLFAIITLDIIGDSFVPARFRKLAFPVMCALLAILSFAPNWRKFVELRNVPHFTTIGGNKEKYFAELTEFLVQNKKVSNDLFIPRDSKAFSNFYSFQMYTNLATVPLNFASSEDVSAMLKRVPVMVVAKPQHLIEIRNCPLSSHIKIKELRHFGAAQESLYLLTKSDEFQLDQKLPSFFLSFATGVYHEEEKDGVHFRWAGKNAELKLDALVPGRYTIEFGVVTNFSDSQNELSIFCNDTLIQKSEFSGYNFVSPRTVTFKVNVNSTKNVIRLVSRSEGSKFPKDEREIAYGLILPIRVQELKK